MGGWGGGLSTLLVSPLWVFFYADVLKIRTDLTFVDKQQLPLVYMLLGEVEHRPHGVSLQGQVSVAGRGHHEVQLRWGRVHVLRPQILWPDLRHRGHPHLDGHNRSHLLFL